MTSAAHGNELRWSSRSPCPSAAQQAPAGARRDAPAAPPTAARRLAGGPDRHLGVGGDRGLAVAHDHAAQGRLPQHPADAGGAEDADAWDPARDAAAGEQCRAYGAPRSCVRPGRVRLSWENDTTLKVETEAGTQTRLFVFGAQRRRLATPGWQGTSAADWQPAGGGGGRRGGGRRAAGPCASSRPTCVPATCAATVCPTARTCADGVLHPHQPADRRRVARRHDGRRGPVYLTARWVTSTHFKKLPDGSPWTPVPCE